MQFDFGRAAKKLEQENSLRAQKAKQRLAREKEENKKIQQQIQARQEEQRLQRLRELERQEAVCAGIQGHPAKVSVADADRVSHRHVSSTRRISRRTTVCGGKQPCVPLISRVVRQGLSRGLQTR